MASSRGTRKSSRNATPESATPHDASTSSFGQFHQRVNGNTAGEWPDKLASRLSGSSAQQNSGAGQPGLHTASAATSTGPRLKLRVKQYDPTHRPKGMRNGDAHASRAAPKHSDLSTISRPSLKGTRTTTAGKQPAGEPLVYEDDAPPTRIFGGSISSSRPLLQVSTSTSKSTTTPDDYLHQVVESAVNRAQDLGNEILGLAIHRLYQESRQNSTLRELLEAVLSQRPSPQQARDFQAYIRSVRKQIKMEHIAERVVLKSGNTLEANSSMKPRSRRSQRSRSRNMNSPSNLASNTTSSPAQRSVHGEKRASNHEDEPPAKRSKRSESASSTSSLSSTHSLDLDADTMPVIDEPVSVTLGPKLRSGPGLKHSSLVGKQAAGTKRAGGTLVGPTGKGDKDDANIAELAVKKRKLIRTFDDFKVEPSGIRRPPKPKHLDTPAIRQVTAEDATSVRRSSRAQEFEDLQSPASSAQGEFLVPPPPGALKSSRSRGATPIALGRPRTTVKRSARVKMSPMKKSVVTAGIARLTRARDQDTEPTDEGDGENADFCSACGGNGELLCCDGCTRSFHFRCLDPPMGSSQPPEGEWFCFVCASKRAPAPRAPAGILTSLSQLLEKQNPVAFSLPHDIRDFFEGVRTGEEGEYEEVNTGKNKNNKLIPGYDELHNDNFKIKDAKNHVILCVKCGKSALGRREIISCDHCSLKWHLDCLDPPMANPPVRDPHNRQKNGWMCPVHADHLLLTVGHCGRRHKVRRPKKPRIVDSSLRRGCRNNGIIEIQNDLSDVEETLGPEESVVYRLSEKGVKLDFIDRTKRAIAEKRERSFREFRVAREQATEAAALAAQEQKSFITRPILDQRAALALEKLKNENDIGDGDADRMQTLTHTLISEAPPRVVAMAILEERKGSESMNYQAPSVPPSPPPSDSHGRGLDLKDKQTLLLLRELISSRLAEAEGLS